jgi:type III pantothenate kinase
MTSASNKKNHDTKTLNRLVIDFGNTLIKMAIFKNDDIVEMVTLKNFDENIVNELITKHPARHAIISSVVILPDEVLKFLSTKFDLTDLNHKTPIPISNKYKTPETLGKDRLAVAVAANSMFPGQPCLVIDAGTCITFDIVDAGGVYHGGGISPGINMRFKALHTFTQRLPLVKHQKFESLSGTTTEESILSGVLIGTVAEVDGIISMYQNKYEALNIIVTGGDLNFFAKKLKSNIFAVPNLVLKGLNEILSFNVRQQQTLS